MFLTDKRLLNGDEINLLLPYYYLPYTTAYFSILFPTSLSHRLAWRVTPSP